MEKKSVINNEFYHSLGDKWYSVDDHPIAFLRAEHEARIPWMLDKINQSPRRLTTLLDVGCGGGLFSNRCAKEGLSVVGIDRAQEALDVAKQYDTTQSVRYLRGDALELPFDANSFDIVCALDLLEHVERPECVVRESARVLKKGGLFFFHTFNRTFFSYLVAVKGIEWFVSNAPKNIHVYSLFLKPKEVTLFCKQSGLEVVEMSGFAPKIFHSSFLKLLTTRKVPKNFSFRFSKSLLSGYTGIARKI